MKRIKIALIMMIVCAVAAVGIYFLANSISGKNAEKAVKEANKLVIFDFDSNNTTNLKIHNEGGDYEMEYSKSTSWKMLSETDFEVNSNTAIAICTAMENLTAQKIIEDTDTAKFGFDDPVILTAKADGKEYTLYVGDPTPTNESYYVMKEGSDNIYLIDYKMGVILDVTKNGLKSEYLADFLSTEVNSFALWKGSESDENILFSLSMDDNGTWHMEKPNKNASISHSAVSEFVNNAIRDKINSFVIEDCPESDYEKYGFDDPKYVFEISSKDKTIKVIFGDNTNNDEYIYGLFTQNGQVVTFENSAVSVLGYDTDDFLS